MNHGEMPSETQTTEIEVQDLNDEIPGLENLPPETQEVVIESYEILEEGHQTINKYIEATKHTENIPKALSIIDNNIPTEEERVVEISPEKQEYIEDTVRVVDLCHKVVNIGIYNIDVKNQVGIYEVLEGYASKYNLIASEYVRNQFKDIGIEEAREYYAKTPQATLRRIRDKIQKKGETPQLKSRYVLSDLAEYILKDYTLGSKSAQNETYENTLNMLKTFCSETSITDENFLNTLDGKTKEINQLYQEILVDEKCRDVISKRTGVTFDSMEPLEPIHWRNHQEGPLLDTKRIFSSTIKGKINGASDNLKRELENKEGIAVQNGVKFGRDSSSPVDSALMPELNKVKRKCILAKEQYLRNLTTIDNMLPLTETQLDSSNLVFPFWFESIVSKEDMEKVEQVLKDSLQSGKLFFHGTGSGGDDVLLAILTNGLMSRRKQMEIQGWSRYNTRKDINQPSEEQKREFSEYESDSLFFARDFDGAYRLKARPIDHFVVGIPEGIVRRNYSLSSDSFNFNEVVLKDRENPDGGCLIKPGDAYLFIGTKHFQELKSLYEKAGKHDFEERVKTTWGDKLIISDETPPKSDKNLNLPPVKNARVLPSKTKRGYHIRKTVYS